MLWFVVGKIRYIIRFRLAFDGLDVTVVSP